MERQNNINPNNNSQIRNARNNDKDDDPILILNFKNYLDVAGRASIELAKAAQAYVDNNAITDVRFRNEAARIATTARTRKVELNVVSSSDGNFSEQMLAEWLKV